MSSLLFYLIIIVILLAVISLFVYQRRQQINTYRTRRQPPVVGNTTPVFIGADKLINDQPFLDSSKHSPYDPNLIVLQVKAFPGRPYMGYELHQALLSSELRFDNQGIFHRYGNSGKNNVLFSVAAATSSGLFAVEDLGGFKCSGLLIFMRLDTKQKLMASFDLMLDTARQLSEELGGEIYDDLQQLISASVIKRLREKICMIETGNLYNADLLDNLD